MPKKKVSNDVILVIVSISVGVFFIWTQQTGISNRFDFQIYLVTFMAMVTIPILYSSYVFLKNNKKL